MVQGHKINEKFPLIHIYIYPIPLHDQDVIQDEFIKWNLTGLNSEFSFS